MQVRVKYIGDSPDGKRTMKGINSFLKSDKGLTKRLKCGRVDVATIGGTLQVSTEDGLIITLDSTQWKVEVSE